MEMTAQQLFDCSQHFNYNDVIKIWRNEYGQIFASSEDLTIKLDKGYGPKRIGYQNSWERV